MNNLKWKESGRPYRTPKLLCNIIIGFSVVTGCLALAACAADPGSGGPGRALTADDGVDVTREFLSLNNQGEERISDSFRKGHVKKINTNLPVIKTESGWEIQLGRTNIPSPVVYEGMVFVSGGFGSREYYACDAVTGRRIWSISLDDDGPSSAAVVDGVVVFNTESCTVFACRADTGEQLWSYWLGDPLMCMPAIANGIVFTAYPAPQGGPVIAATHGREAIRGTHIVIAIELHTGKILWQKWIDGDVMSAPVAVGDDLFISTFSGTLFRFKQSSGDLLSARAVRATSAPLVHHERVVVSRRTDGDNEKAAEAITDYGVKDMKEGREYNAKQAPYLDKEVQARSTLKSSSMAYDAANGFSSGAPEASGWKKANDTVGQSNVSSLQSFQGSRTLYRQGRNYQTMGNELICTDDKTGKVDWKLRIEGDAAFIGGFLGTPPVAAGDNIILAKYAGEISVYQPETGTVKKSFRIRDRIRYQPVVENGWMYVSTANGRLLAINTRDKTLTGWPMWGGNPARTNLPD